MSDDNGAGEPADAANTNVRLPKGRSSSPGNPTGAQPMASIGGSPTGAGGAAPSSSSTSPSGAAPAAPGAPGGAGLRPFLATVADGKSLSAAEAEQARAA